MYTEISVLYSNYIKYLINFKARSQLLSIRMTEVSQKAKNFSIKEILSNYEHLDALIQMIFATFEH